MKLMERCLHCHEDVASGQKGKHCASPHCSWLKHNCGAILDLKNGRGFHGSHGMACQSELSPCRNGRT